MPSDGGNTTIWKDIGTYCDVAYDYLDQELPSGTNRAAWLADALSQLNDLESGYSSFKSSMASSGLAKLREWYIIPLYSYTTMLSTMTGIPNNLQIQRKFLSPQYGTSDASSTYDDLRNSVISWNQLSYNYSQLFTIPSSSPPSTATPAGVTTLQSLIDDGYSKWDGYMNAFNNAFIQENCAIAIWGTYNPDQATNIGSDRVTWDMPPDLKSAVLNSDTFTTGPNNTTIQPMHFLEVVEEVGWDIVGINIAGT